MRILLIHNFYQQPGGEDGVFAAEKQLLDDAGHQTLTFERRNDDVGAMGKLSLAKATIWNKKSYRELREVVRQFKPDVAHFHNTLPLISPAGYYAAGAQGAKVVQTLHNFRLLCPSATLFHDGQEFYDSVGKLYPWQAVRKAVYRDSRSATAVVGAMLAFHRLIGTYRRKVDAYIALSAAGRDLFIRGGLPEERIAIKPNFLVEDPGIGPGGGGYALFVGRLSEEKGIATLIEAWKRLKAQGRSVPLKFIGDGPMAGQVKALADADPSVQWLGRQNTSVLLEAMGKAELLIHPSVWLEGMPRTMIESFAKGTPIVASRLGVMADMVQDGHNGWLAPPGDADALADTVLSALQHPEVGGSFRKHARSAFEQHYTAEANLGKLLEIYHGVLGKD